MNSHLDDHDSFKEILGEILLILNNNNNSNSNSNANIELLNFFLFNYNLLIPPNHCLMGINYKYSTVNMYFPSVSEIPTTLNDSNMRILFSILDIRIIIKLYMCLLTERKIVLVSKKDNSISDDNNTYDEFCILYEESDDLPLEVKSYVDDVKINNIGNKKRFVKKKVLRK